MLSWSSDENAEHRHEGDVGAPMSDPSARVIATGVSQVTGRIFNIAVALEESGDGGRAIALRHRVAGPCLGEIA
jgi:hypothetical protein